jgi:hypothetical protein
LPGILTFPGCSQKDFVEGSSQSVTGVVDLLLGNLFVPCLATKFLEVAANSKPQVGDTVQISTLPQDDQQ